MMKTKIIAKTLLAIWPGLADYEAMLANRALTHALCSYNAPLLTERIIDKIIDLNVKQQTIHKLKSDLDRLLQRLDNTTQQVVTSYYQGFAPADNVPHLAARFGIAERSYYRKLNNAVDYVAHHLPQLGINFFTWQHLLHHHRWIKETFLREGQPHRRNPLRVRD